MFNEFPKNYEVAKGWTWEDYRAYGENLLGRELTAETVDGWLEDEGKLLGLYQEIAGWAFIRSTQDTSDEAAMAWRSAVGELEPKFSELKHELDQKLLASGLVPKGHEVEIHRLKVKADLYSAQNDVLGIEIGKLRNEYNRITGGQEIEWEGERISVQEISKVLDRDDRDERERVYRLKVERQTQDRPALNRIWEQVLRIRYTMGKNAGFENYRDYRWVQLNRFDYGPEDALRFCESVEKVVVPIVSQLYQEQAERLGVEKLKAWDVGYDPRFGGNLRPFETIEELEEKAAVVFGRIDPILGDYFKLLRREQLMDLEARANKSPFSYSEALPFSRKPFVFATIGGTHLDMMSVFHEAGHAFHVLEGAGLPHRVMLPGAEMCEVASTTMEFLASEHLDVFYTEREAKQARVIQLEAILKELPEIAVGVAFQHWLYTQDGPPRVEDCDKKWAELWERFMAGIDYEGVEDAVGNFWRHVARLYFFPFYFIEYAMAQIGAIQIWQRYLENPAQAVADYRAALGMGNTVGLPALYERAGAKFAFDEGTLREMVRFLMMKIEVNQISHD